MDLIKTSLQSNILQINLNRPEQLNALNQSLLTELLNILNEAKTNSNIKALLLTGEGKAFCAGADIKELSQLTGTKGLEFARFGQQVFSSLEQLGKPTLAAIQGFAFGGGCELAMATTLRIATKDAAFSQPEIKLGVIPGFGGSQRLSRLVGKGRALELCLSGRRFSATEGLQWGLINEVVDPEKLISRAQTILQELINLSSFAIKSIMTVINEGYDLNLEEALQLEATYFGLCCTTKNKQEGVNAFLEKRPAKFNGE